MTEATDHSWEILDIVPVPSKYGRVYWVHAEVNGEDDAFLFYSDEDMRPSHLVVLGTWRVDLDPVALEGYGAVLTKGWIERFFADERRMEI